MTHAGFLKLNTYSIFMASDNIRDIYDIREYQRAKDAFHRLLLQERETGTVSRFVHLLPKHGAGTPGKPTLTYTDIMKRDVACKWGIARLQRKT